MGDDRVDRWLPAPGRGRARCLDWLLSAGVLGPPRCLDTRDERAVPRGVVRGVPRAVLRGVPRGVPRGVLDEAGGESGESSKLFSLLAAANSAAAANAAALPATGANSTFKSTVPYNEIAEPGLTSTTSNMYLSLPY